jgi:hypothetical protein
MISTTYPFFTDVMCRYMEGFQWALKGESTCINLFLSRWTLNTQGKVFAGMFGVILLGIGVEGISRLRHDLSNKARGSHPDEHFKYTLMQTGLHGLHAFTGYMLMLATMTFAWELMFSVIFGLMIGYYNFGGYTTTSSNPCCAFLEVESDSPGPSLEPLLPRSEESVSVSQEEGCCNGGNIATTQDETSTRRESSSTDLA